MKGGTWVNRSGWMQYQIIRGSPLRPDRSKLIDFYLFFWLARAGCMPAWGYLVSIPGTIKQPMADYVPGSDLLYYFR